MKKSKKLVKEVKDLDKDLAKDLAKEEEVKPIEVRKRFCYTVVNGIPVATYK